MFEEDFAALESFLIKIVGEKREPMDISLDKAFKKMAI